VEKIHRHKYYVIIEYVEGNDSTYSIGIKESALYFFEQKVLLEYVKEYADDFNSIELGHVLNLKDLELVNELAREVLEIVEKYGKKT
jgi:hypothetical protein